MKYLNTTDPNTIKKIIQTDFPEIKIDSIKLHENGWDNVVAEINEKYIFRFPKDPGESEYLAIAKNFDLEINILKYLKDKISLSIPAIDYIGKTCLYSGYEKIPGEKLTREILNSLNPEQKNQLVSDLANFLREIHEALSPAEASAEGVEVEDHDSYSKMIKEKLLPRIKNEKISEFIKATCREYDIIPNPPEKSVFLYNDLHAENMAFDPAAKKLNGIFDFGDLAIGDINRDFNSLFNLDHRLMKEVAEKYQLLTEFRLNTHRMMIYSQINDLCDLAEYFDQPESKVYKSVMSRIDGWIGNNVSTFADTR